MNIISEALMSEIKAIVEQSTSRQTKELTKKFEDILNPPKVNYTVKEVAKKLNVTELTVRNYITKGFIPATKIGRRVVINGKDLEESLAEVKSLKYRRNG